MITAHIVKELVDVSGAPLASKAVYVAGMFKQPTSLEALARDIGTDPDRVAKHCRALERLGWMRFVRSGRQVRPETIVPHDVEARIAVDIRREVSVSPFKGEATTIFFIEWLVAPGVRLIVHARPDFLCNDETGYNLEYDIFAPDYAWAIEYHGDQHFGPTTRYPSKDAFIDRHKRDLRKIYLSNQNGIRLSVVHNQILTLEGVLGVIPRDVPLRALNPRGPVILTLEDLGREVAGNQGWDRE